MSEQHIFIDNSSNSSTNNSQINVKFPLSQDFTNKEVALSSLIMYYSWRNITSAFNNNSVSISYRGTNYPIVFPDGFYTTSSTINDINSFLQLQMLQNNLYLIDSNGNTIYYLNLSVNVTYYCLTLTCTPVPNSLPTGWSNPGGLNLSGYCPQLVVNNSAFQNIIGFAPGSFPPTATNNVVYQINSTVTPQTSPISVVYVRCNLVSNNGTNNYGDAIYTFTPTVGYGSQIVERPSRLVFSPIASGSYSGITLSFYDQLGRPIAIIDPTTTVIQLVIRNK
jgi:hypothetical protein